jgi:hypothetical protein
MYDDETTESKSIWTKATSFFAKTGSAGSNEQSMSFAEAISATYSLLDIADLLQTPATNWTRVQFLALFFYIFF